VTRQHHHVLLDVVADLEDAGIFEQYFESRQRLARRNLSCREPALGQKIVGGAMAERHVARAVGLERHGDAGDLGLHRIGRRGAQRHGDDAVAPRLGDPVV
jgi:hypothetical protein